MRNWYKLSWRKYSIPILGFIIFGLLLTAGFVNSFASVSQSNLSTTTSLMTQEKLERAIKKISHEFSGNTGNVQFEFEGIKLFCISDARHDRMRIVSPIKRSIELASEQKDKMLDANFHSALDARYATSDGVLYAAYIHPLSPLTERELISSISQVASLVKSFGTTYSSGALHFGGANQ